MRTLVMTILAMLFATIATAQDTYKIKSGDTLRVEVLEDPSLNRDVIVLPDGRFSFPFAGTVSAGGRSLDQVSAALADGIASNFATTPNVFVSIAGIRPSSGGSAPATISVFFVGEVNTPGQIKVERGTTFLQAMGMNGGFSKFAAQKRVQLRRTDKRTGAQSIYNINYRDIAAGSTAAKDVVLMDGDVILVPERRLFE